jgi:hypothetical protein
MASMKAQNQVLFYRLLQTHLKEMFGVIYTPTEADAIQNYSRLFRKPEGCFLNINDSGLESIEASLENFAPRDGGEVDYIVVSDGEQVCFFFFAFSVYCRLFLGSILGEDVDLWVVDPGYRRSRRRRDPHLRRQARHHDSMRGDPSVKTTPRCA